MLSNKRGRQKYKTYDKLSYAPDDIQHNLYKTTALTFPEAEPINYKIFVPHPLNRNYTARQRNVQAALLEKKHSRLVFEQKTVNLARAAAERLVQFYGKFKEEDLQMKHQQAAQDAAQLSAALVAAYHRDDLAGLDLPFIADGELARAILGRKQ